MLGGGGGDPGCYTRLLGFALVQFRIGLPDMLCLSTMYHLRPMSANSGLWAGSGVCTILPRHELLLPFCQGCFWRPRVQHPGALTTSSFCADLHTRSMLGQQTSEAASHKVPWGCSPVFGNAPGRTESALCAGGCFSPVQQSPVWGPLLYKFQAIPSGIPQWLAVFHLCCGLGSWRYPPDPYHECPRS